ncbi:MAG: hypothetical protein HRT74_03665 [Flavobacteriales bacterium]|nr:hypothetical protein [Flavobacteriales bacterium]
MVPYYPSKISRFSQYLAYLHHYEAICIQIAHGEKRKKAERAVYGSLLAEYAMKHIEFN